jgi:pimeloyl-ACP methyl ester carboxylesterase
MQPLVMHHMSTDTTNIVLVHGAWSDGSVWRKVIPILKYAGHKVVAVQLPFQSLTNDVYTVKNAIEYIGGPTILVGHSYGGEVISNAAYNNPKVKGLVYLAAFAPDEGESLGTYVDSTIQYPKEFFVPDNGGCIYINTTMFREFMAHDIDLSEADVWAVIQKPMRQSIFTEKSGPPAWKQLPTWYQISEDDRMIPPDVQHAFAKQINATTLSLKASHSFFVSHPNEIADFILNATKESKQ